MQKYATVILITTPMWCGVCLFLYGLAVGWVKPSLQDENVQLTIAAFFAWLFVASLLAGSFWHEERERAQNDPWEDAVQGATIHRLNGHEYIIEKDGMREIVGQDINDEWYHKEVSPDGTVGPIVYGSERSPKGSKASVISAVKFKFNSRKK